MFQNTMHQSCMSQVVNSANRMTKVLKYIETGIETTAMVGQDLRENNTIGLYDSSIYHLA